MSPLVQFLAALLIVAVVFGIPFWAGIRLGIAIGRDKERRRI